MNLGTIRRRTPSTTAPIRGGSVSLRPRPIQPQWLEQIAGDVHALPGRYQTLLQSHAKAHGELFKRVTLDLGGGDDRHTPTEELFARAETGKEVPPALMEKIYDAGRYMYLCCSGEAMPNLYGIWTGIWSPAWSGDFTTDANLQCAIAAGLSGNMPEGMQGYFRMIESWLPDCRSMRGGFTVVAAFCQQPRVEQLPDVALGSRLAGPVLDLRRRLDEPLVLRLLPVHGRPPVSGPKGGAVVEGSRPVLRRFSPGLARRPGQLPLSSLVFAGVHSGDNATMDIAVAREVLTNLIAAARN